jgi:integrative and conjugative element protein (TIGR02256 family)
VILSASEAGLYVLIPAAVIRKIDRYKTDLSEAGGIFLGKYRGPHIEIVDATEPMAGDTRHRTRFDRDDAGHQYHAEMQWRASGGSVTFVGEWHTHPQTRPIPSSVDLRTWSTISKRQPTLPHVFAIRGSDDWWFGFRPAGGQRQVIQLSILPTEHLDDTEEARL